MRCAVILLSLSLSGCLDLRTLPKIIEVRYTTDTGARMLLLCLKETRADTPPVTYECDTGEIR